MFNIVQQGGQKLVIRELFELLSLYEQNAAAVAADSHPFLKGPVKACFVDYRAAERGFAYALQSFGKFQVFYTAAVFKRGSAYTLYAGRQRFEAEYLTPQKRIRADFGNGVGDAEVFEIIAFGEELFGNQRE